MSGTSYEATFGPILTAIEAAGCHEFDLGAVARRVGAPHPPAPLAPELLRAVTAR